LIERWFSGLFRFAKMAPADSGVRRLAQLRRLGRSASYFRGVPSQKCESNQRRLLANRL
jgi:hypothetical protein